MGVVSVAAVVLLSQPARVSVRERHEVPEDEEGVAERHLTLREPCAPPQDHDVL